ncbi:hypothetical protein AB3M93_13655 [Novosphingobium panipatense]|uniref:hypothetical protein n=1 Tax=Novosphingobium panipatense TaxID=428991 RepID=UPI0039A3370E
MPKLADANFAKEQAGNPHAVTDAKVADDLDKIIKAVTVRQANGKLSKAHQSTLLSRIDDLCQRRDKIGPGTGLKRGQLV